MNPRRFAIATLLLCLALPAPALAQAGATKAAKAAEASKDLKVRKLLQLTGASSLGRQMIDGMLAQFEQVPNVPQGFIAKFKELAKPDSLVDLIVPVYLKHLDEADIDAAIAFYQSPAGKRFIAAQPVMLEESMEVGRQWGMDLAQRAKRMLDAGK